MAKSDQLKRVVRDLAEANEALLQLAAVGDREQVTALLNRVAQLERQRNRLLHRGTESTAVRPGYTSVVPLRDKVIRALHLVSRPATGRLLSDVSRACWGDRIETVKLSSLRRDEANSWDAAQDRDRRTAMREVYVVPALSYDRFAPVRGTLALSTWQTARRLIAPLSPRVDMLRSTISLATEADKLAGNGPGEALCRIVARLGASIPDARPFGASLHEIIAAAEAELAEIEETDERERAAAARRAEGQLNARALLFGAPLRAVRSARTRGAS